MTRERTRSRLWGAGTALERFLILQESLIRCFHRSFYRNDTCDGGYAGEPCSCCVLLGKNSEFGRLEIASKEIRSEFPNSIRISKYQAAISELEDGNVWVNRELLPDYPAYMAGIRKTKNL